MDHRQAIQTAMAAAAGEQPPQNIVPRHYHWLLRLPARFWSEMHYYLDYPEILALSQLSSQFKEQRLEEFLPWTVRHAFVAHLELNSRREKRCACYLCFRIRGDDQFYKADEMATHARVIQRDWYRGRRVFERVPPPSPGQRFSIIDPPSPVGTMSSFFLAQSGAIPQMGASMSMGVPLSIHMDANMRMAPMGSMQGQLPAMRIPMSTAMLVQRPHWRPRAPGAEVGKIESLRRYCTDCAIETRLLCPGDFMAILGENMWLCHCRNVHRKEENARCPTCGMNPIYRA
ncbi:hypothetical protein F503_03026 [Ophiostoma piceae UAMH 11346]|uniref:Uncharacterized protein n=1 Tax=Ophiostoma piceae (strain UAMH 11346) TaxID=1262450 RepID=S3C0D1_OPHP1|nr:hypothetical protein F503_03026 [Ophiostoma piceae UAMH 11346]